MAASAKLLPLLVGLGFDELSMSAAAIPGIKARLAALDSAACARLVRSVLDLDRPAAVEQALEAFDRPPATRP